jgi:hypothetical protein
MFGFCGSGIRNHRARYVRRKFKEQGRNKKEQEIKSCLQIKQISIVIFCFLPEFERFKTWRTWLPVLLECYFQPPVLLSEIRGKCTQITSLQPGITGIAVNQDKNG